MRSITIYKRCFYNSDCYKSARRQKQCGVQVHSTGANNPYLSRYVQPDDGLLGKNKYGNDSNRSGTNVCASAYIGKQSNGMIAIYQSLPWDYQCWLSEKGDNGNANKLGYIGFEICEDSLNDREYFNEAVLRLSVNLTAYLLNMIGASPDSIVAKFNKDTAISVMDHHELRDITISADENNRTRDSPQPGRHAEAKGAGRASVRDDQVVRRRALLPVQRKGKGERRNCLKLPHL